VRPPGVVFVPPVFDEYAGFGEGSELGDVQQFVADSAVERSEEPRRSTVKKKDSATAPTIHAPHPKSSP